MLRTLLASGILLAVLLTTFGCGCGEENQTKDDGFTLHLIDPVPTPGPTPQEQQAHVAGVLKTKEELEQMTIEMQGAQSTKQSRDTPLFPDNPTVTINGTPLTLVKSSDPKVDPHMVLTVTIPRTGPNSAGDVKVEGDTAGVHLVFGPRRLYAWNGTVTLTGSGDTPAERDTATFSYRVRADVGADLAPTSITAQGTREFKVVWTVGNVIGGSPIRSKANVDVPQNFSGQFVAGSSFSASMTFALSSTEGLFAKPTAAITVKDGVKLTNPDGPADPPTTDFFLADAGLGNAVAVDKVTFMIPGGSSGDPGFTLTTWSDFICENPPSSKAAIPIGSTSAKAMEKAPTTRQATSQPKR